MKKMSNATIITAAIISPMRSKVGGAGGNDVVPAPNVLLPMRYPMNTDPMTMPSKREALAHIFQLLVAQITIGLISQVLSRLCV